MNNEKEFLKLLYSCLTKGYVTLDIHSPSGYVGGNIRVTSEGKQLMYRSEDPNDFMYDFCCLRACGAYWQCKSCDKWKEKENETRSN